MKKGPNGKEKVIDDWNCVIIFVFYVSESPLQNNFRGLEVNYFMCDIICSCRIWRIKNDCDMYLFLTINLFIFGSSQT